MRSLSAPSELFVCDKCKETKSGEGSLYRNYVCLAFTLDYHICEECKRALGKLVMEAELQAERDFISSS